MTSECTAEAIYLRCLSPGTIPADEVRAWMRCEDVQAMGALWMGLLEYNQDHVAPRLGQEEVLAFRFLYFARCIAEDPHGRWTLDRSESAKEVVRWFWSIEEFGDCELEPADIRDWLADTYTHGHDDVKSTIVDRILARLFEYRVWRDFFYDWDSDAVLQPAYRTASGIGLRNSAEDVIDDVLASLSSDAEIPQAVVRCWMEIRNPDLLGGVWDFIISSQPVLARISPPFSNDELDSFAMPYLAACINEDPARKWGPSRYEAAREVLEWIHSLDCTHDRSEIERIVDWLTELYLGASDAARDAITAGALEHILEVPCYRPFFHHWSEHPVLKSSYEPAMDWAVAHER